MYKAIGCAEVDNCMVI